MYLSTILAVYCERLLSSFLARYFTVLYVSFDTPACNDGLFDGMELFRKSY